MIAVGKSAFFMYLFQCSNNKTTIRRQKMSCLRKSHLKISRAKGRFRQTRHKPRTLPQRGQRSAQHHDLIGISGALFLAPFPPIPQFLEQNWHGGLFFGLFYVSRGLFVAPFRYAAMAAYRLSTACARAFRQILCEVLLSVIADRGNCGSVAVLCCSYEVFYEFD